MPNREGSTPRDIQRKIQALSQQVSQLYRAGRFGQALPIAIQVRDLTRQQRGESHPDYANSLNDLALLYHAMGNYAAAEPLYRQASTIRRKALGEKHPDYANGLNNLAELYREMGNYAAAEPLYRQANEILRKALGENHPDYANGLNNLALLYQAMGNYAAAEPLLRQAGTIRRTALGESDPNYANSLNNLAELYREMGNYAAAEPLYRQANEILRTALGENHPGYANSLNNLALLYQAMGNYAAAEPLLRQAGTIRRTALGENHPGYANSLNNLAALYHEMGNYAAAEPLYRQANEILRKALGENHPDYANGLNNLAELYHEMGNYAAAEPLLRQATEIDRKSLGEQHPGYARDLNNLAGLYDEMGNYAAAEPLYRQASTIRRTALGENHPDYANSLNNLAELYHEMGNYAAAEPLLRQAGEILRTTLGENHPDYANSLNNLALLYRALSNYAAAEPLYRQAGEILRTTLGENHPDYANSLNNLAGLYQAMGNYAAAEPLLRQASQINRKALGEQHPAYAASLNNLAELYSAMGNYAGAEPLYRQAGTIRRTALGENHPDYADSLNSLAALEVATNRVAEAMTLMQEAAVISGRMIGQVFSFGSESQRLAYLDTLQLAFYGFLSLVVQYLSGSEDAVCAGLELVLRRKAIGAEALAAQRDAVLGGRYPGLEPKLRELTTLRLQIAQKMLAGPGPEGLDVHQRQLAEWTAKKESLEEDLARQIPEMSLERQLRSADLSAVAHALPGGAALIEIVRFKVTDFKAVPARGESQWKPAHYLAYVLLAGEPKNVQMIDLGEAEAIDRMVARFRSSITRDPETRNVSVVETQPIQEREPDEGIALRGAIFDPLVKTLGGRRRLFIGPDGQLTRLPFEVLPLDGDRRLIDSYEISYLGVGRDLLRFGAKTSGRPTESLVAADPNFDLGTGDSLAPAGVMGSLKRQSRDLNRNSLNFAPLPGTKAEGIQIAAMLDIFPLLGDEVLESRVERVRSPHILHIATHGFFLPDQPRGPNATRPGFLPEAGTAMGPERFLGAGAENPLLRSGLALAGANTRLQGIVLPEAAGDGIMNAEDVSGLDLLGTELVVLSACGTGLGEVQVGEGVFGLRRSFVLAGAKTLVMSLWDVPDQQTQELMAEFYRRILAGQGRCDALRAAQLSIKEKYSDPLYWGAFICQGDPGPLTRSPAKA
jgi:tetratricopeptide (TPR) repeat protein/CHAT domain-containing protein